MPPRMLFVDTFYWVALINPRDAYHARVTAFGGGLGTVGLITTDEVLMREATDEEIVHTPIDEFQLLGPLTVFHRQLEILDCEFPAPGVYWFQVFLNEKLVAERRFFASETPGGTNGQPHS